MNRPGTRPALFHLLVLLAAALPCSAGAGAFERASAQEPRERSTAGAAPAFTAESAPETRDGAEAHELLPNGRRPLPDLLTGGQPTAEQLEELAGLGYRTVIDLRTEGESGALADEPARVEALGMRYVRLPVAGAAGLSDDNARALDELLAGAGAYPVVLHCGSGNRVGALLALRAALTEGADPDAALQLGLDAGLTRLEPTVRELLGLPDAPAAETP